MPKKFSVIQLFEEQAQLNTEAIATCYNGANICYKELNEKSNQLAHFLISLGIKPETFVGISVDRSLTTIISILGILKTGAVYIPIDPDYPKERINHILTDSKISLLLTESHLLKKFSDSLIKKISIHAEQEKIKKLSTINPNIKICLDSLAYILYTSGSTGKPKGVMVRHSNLINAYNGWKKIYHLKNNDRHLQMSSFSFDVFTGDLLRALCSGGKLALCPREILLEPEKLYALMITEKINCAEFVPTILRKLMNYIKSNDLSLSFMRLLICGSDNWSINEYRKLQKLCGAKVRVINSYGLTEATIDSTYFEDKLASQEKFNANHTVPLGKPFPGTEIFLLNEKLKMVDNGAIGEVYIGGKGLALGYLNNPDLTEKKFIKHLFNTHPKSRLFKTGDQGRYLPDGNIEFLGRIDNQIKLRGIRIELSDIENVLNCFNGIRESLVTMHNDKTQNEFLIAYIVTENNIALNLTDIKKFLRERLPNYMMPSLFIKLDSIPLTPNGKLNRQLVTSFEILLPEKNHVTPKNPLEHQLIILWEKLFPMQKIGTLDDFFDLGGNSLLMADLLAKIEDHFFIKIPSCEISNKLTIADMARLMSKSIVCF
ncbi:MAG TPA: amino acid adenylation domain-containing protein [Gammaproteobacteria bacterium]|nr:amino acid adenylation domain-containing protein [Gammaproteobacteria bacterium]